MTHQPTKQSLIEATRKFLEQELKPALTDTALQYKLRIAMNVLAIVERELAQEHVAEQEQSAGLRHLLDSDSVSTQDMTTQLCQRIQQGKFDSAEDALLEHLEQTALNRLAIDNPRYSTYRQLSLDANQL
jgi:hypothetical protein